MAVDGGSGRPTGDGPAGKGPAGKGPVGDDPTGDGPAGGALHRLLCAGLLLLCAGVLIHLYAGLREAALAASACLVLCFALGLGRVGWRERSLLAAALAVTAAAALSHDAPAALAGRSLERAAFLATFMILIGLLRVGAGTSSSVLALGDYLTRQPPGRRYLAIHTGSHILGVLLNFGTLSLFGPLIVRGVDATRRDEPGAAAVREQRQLSALMRGFSWVIAWSPTAITQALIPVAVIGADPLAVAGMGAAVAAAMLPLGWLNDRIVGRRARRRLAREGLLPAGLRRVFPRAAAVRFSAVCLALIGGCALVVLASGVTVIVALMPVAALATLAWLLVQARAARRAGKGPAEGGSFAARVRGLATVSVPRSLPEALTLATGGYCGLMLAGLLEPARVGAWLQLDRLPAEAIYLLAAAVVPLLSQLAAPPILVVTFFGSVLIGNPALGLDPSLLGFAFVMGWCLNLTGSPFGTTVLMLGRATGVRGTTLSWRWNGLFTLAAFAIVTGALFAFGA